MKMAILFVLIFACCLATEDAQADFISGHAANLGSNVNGSAAEEGPSISADGLTLYFNSPMGGDYSNFDLWMTTRATKDDPWGQPENLGPVVNSGSREHMPSIASDELTLYFSSNRSGSWDIWFATRVTKEDPWGRPVKLGFPVGSGFGPGISADGLSLYFGSNRIGGSGNDDIWVCTRTTTDAPWSTPENLGSTVNGSTMELCPKVSTHNRVLFFSDGVNAPFRPGGYGGGDLWMSTRASDSDPWDVPVNMGPNVNSTAFDGAPVVSADGSMLYFMSGRSGGYGVWDLWQIPILPVVDFTGDYRVDIDDLVILIEHWGQNEPAYDMGPMPWGDGIIDVADLEVLMGYWGQEVYDPHLLAHWTLDESEGDIAYDSITDNDAVVYGEAVWLPENGQIDGALQCDGTTTYVDAPFVLDPAGGPLSIFAWINGGASGQVIISQSSGMDWLAVDTEQGFLRTDLNSASRGKVGPPLVSSVAIADGNWHRIGLVWDGEYRHLYVDDELVAIDVEKQMDLEASEGGMYVGAGTGLEEDTFFSGLIDDVRIYNRVVTQ